MRLKGQSTIITGASRNIGAGIAREFAKEGADICFTYHSKEKEAKELEQELNSCGVKAFALHADFKDSEGVDLFFNKAIEFLGGVDILINNASDYNTDSFLELDINAFQSLLQIGVISVARLSQLAAANMIKNKVNGKIINTSSISGLRPYLNRTAHSSTKASLNMLTQNMALELGKYGIRVNAICPGATPYEDGSGVGNAIEEIPLGCYGEPKDQARAAVFLASDESKWMTGQIMVVDGGHSLSF